MQFECCCRAFHRPFLSVRLSACENELESWRLGLSFFFFSFSHEKKRGGGVWRRSCERSLAVVVACLSKLLLQTGVVKRAERTCPLFVERFCPAHGWFDRVASIREACCLQDWLLEVLVSGFCGPGTSSCSVFSEMLRIATPFTVCRDCKNNSSAQQCVGESRPSRTLFAVVLLPVVSALFLLLFFVVVVVALFIFK
jgi:hypothetical protein